ncbi:MAG TPA: SRPBCC family protein [Pseudonocardiaceae bacterium]|nr:SRPBCC family protein [Pseudonocardiaceae bacterium]
MRLEHEFTVPAPPEVVWQALTDPKRVAPCMPGATLSSVDGGAFTGSVKVKLGPISLLYKGSGEFAETDEQARRAVIKAAGKDARGNGTASATVTVSLTGDDRGTAATVLTDLAVTGKPAQFGRGMISEVGGKILNTFAGCLSGKLAPQVDAATFTAETAEPAPRAERTKPRAEEAKAAEAEPINLIDYAGPSVARRIAPIAGGGLALLALFIVVRRLRHRD